MSFPARIKSDLPRFNFCDYPNLTFELPDKDLFRSLALAYIALQAGGNMPCILNAANEVAVNAFLKGRIGFLVMPEVVEHCMKTASFILKPCYEDYVATHHETLERAEIFINQRITNKNL